MDINVAVITTELLKDFITQTFYEIKPAFSYELFIYHDFPELKSLYASIPPHFQGVIPSGIFPAQVIRNSFPEDTRVMQTFNLDDVSLYRLFLNLLQENRQLDFSRVYSDFLDLIGKDASGYLAADNPAAYDESVTARVMSLTLDEIIQMERDIAAKHLRLWQDGAVDMTITRFSSIVPALRAKGVNIRFAYPSKKYLAGICRNLVAEIQLRQLHDNQPGVVNLSFRADPADLPFPFQDWELKSLQLQHALLDFTKDARLDFVLQKNSLGYEMITNRKTLEKRTDGYRHCALKPFLKTRLPFAISIGYGLGRDIYQARLNAISANKESAAHAGGASYLMNEQDMLIGPLDGGSPLAVSSQVTPYIRQTARNASLSPLTVAKVFSVLADLGTDRITSQELSRKLGVTVRSASRFLKSLTESGAMEIAYEHKSISRGRPERVYRLANAKSEEMADAERL